MRSGCGSQPGSGNLGFGELGELYFLERGCANVWVFHASTSGLHKSDTPFDEMGPFGWRLGPYNKCAETQRRKQKIITVEAGYVFGCHVSMPFLTDLDSRASIKGSRDPLGVQAIWTSMGRHVVGNLTTVSTSVRDFTVTMLGYYFAERVAEETGASDDVNVFLRWEQLAAYARGGGNNDWEFRGTERARRNWNESDHIRLAADSGSLILSDQKTYGLWGLYSVPARSSGLVEGSPTRLTSEARRFVENNYVPALGSKTMARRQGLERLLAERSVSLRPKDKDRPLFDAVAKVLRRKLSTDERSFFDQPNRDTRGM